jgi:WD40 repeat protein
MAEGRSLIAEGRDDGTVSVWNVETDTREATLKIHVGMVNCVAWSASGHFLLTSGVDSKVALWAILNGRCTVISIDGIDVVSSISWAPRRAGVPLFESNVVMGYDSGIVTSMVIRARAPTFGTPLTGQHTASVAAIAWSPDGRFWATGSADRSVKIWNAADGTSAPRLDASVRFPRAHDTPVTSVAWSPDSSRLASATHEDIKVWDSDTGACVATLNNIMLIKECDSISWSPDGARLAAASNFCVIQSWDMTTYAQQPNIVDGDAQSVYTIVAWSPSGSHLAYTDDARECAVIMDWASQGRVEDQLLPPGDAAEIKALAWCPVRMHPQLVAPYIFQIGARRRSRSPRGGRRGAAAAGSSRSPSPPRRRAARERRLSIMRTCDSGDTPPLGEAPASVLRGMDKATGEAFLGLLQNGMTLTAAINALSIRVTSPNTCVVCLEEKPLDQFHISKGCAHRNVCKPCWVRMVRRGIRRCPSCRAETSGEESNTRLQLRF